MKKSLSLDSSSINPGPSRVNHSPEGDSLLKNARLSAPTEITPVLSKVSISSGAASQIAQERRRARISRFAELRAEAKMAQVTRNKSPKVRHKIKVAGGGLIKLEGLSMVDRLVNFIARGIKLLEILLLTAIGRRKEFKPITKSEKPEASPVAAQKKAPKREIQGQSPKLS